MKEQWIHRCGFGGTSSTHLPSGIGVHLDDDRRKESWDVCDADGQFIAWHFKSYHEAISYVRGLIAARQVMKEITCENSTSEPTTEKSEDHASS